jgi:hypothetical protein
VEQRNQILAIICVAVKVSISHPLTVSMTLQLTLLLFNVSWHSFQVKGIILPLLQKVPL